MAKCKNCGKEIPKNQDFCSKECMEAYKQRNSFSQPIPIEKILSDSAYQRGTMFRAEKLEAISQARKQGLSEEQILKWLMKGGLTETTARKMMRDSERVYGE